MQLTFEEAMTQLEKIVARLEDENIPLEEALKEYEQAIVLVKYCNEVLAKAEVKVTEITEGE